MSPELLTAVKERVERGYSDEQIRAELQTAGHADAVIEEVLRAARTDGEEGLSHIPAADLPKVTDLFSDGLEYIKKHLVLSVILAVPITLLFVLEFMQTAVSEFSLPLSIAALVVAVLNFICTVAVLYVVVTDSAQETVPLTDAFSWTAKNIGGVLWLVVLAFCVIWGGLTLLVIPGLIVSFYIYFAQYVYIDEGLRGFPALLRSRQLVRGNAIAVVGRLLGVGLLFIGLFILVFLSLGLVISLLSVATGNDISSLPATDLLIGLLGQLAGAALTVFGFRVITKLYRALRAQQPYNENTLLEAKKTYTALAIWGAIAFLFLVTVMVKYGSEFELNNSQGDTPSTEEHTIDLNAKDRAVELRVNQ